ncbi:MAG: undecaprenyl-diphosphate phosphatase [Tissierellia bacterium]|nr:undecaprenyl-diphosphate phosphatase [Tissierellia bacterium]
MMEYIIMILLGIVQGITEFLPISSSGHLILFQKALGLKEPGLFIAQMLHFGTFMSVCILFFQDIRQIIVEFFQLIYQLIKREKIKLTYYQKLGLLILLGSVPTAIIAIFFEDTFKALYQNNIFLAGMFMVTAILLYLLDISKTSNRSIDQMRYSGAFAIGSIQGLAILPGISRSGSTIFAATFLGQSRKEAARFSFLLSLPATFGAFLFGMKEVFTSTEKVYFTFPLFIGMIVSMVVGIICLRFLLNLLQQKKMRYFSYYLVCIAVITCFI